MGAARRLRLLIEDLLALSRVEARARRWRPPIAGALLDGGPGKLRDTIEENGAEVTRSPLPKIEVEPSLIVQLFQNLIGNGIKFRGAETAEVHVAARREGREWVFSVRDNGIGIDPAEAEAIFAIFKRLPSGDPGHRHRSRDLQEDRRAPRRAHLGGVRARPRIDLLFHDPRAVITKNR